MTSRKSLLALGIVALLVAGVLRLTVFRPLGGGERSTKTLKPLYQPRLPVDMSGFSPLTSAIKRWKDPTSLEEIRKAFVDLGHRGIAEMKNSLPTGFSSNTRREVYQLIMIATFHLYEGESRQAYQILGEARRMAESYESLAEEFLYTVIYLQGVVGLRRGEDDNCLQCRGDGACIFPLCPTAIHRDPTGSRLAIRHFTEYLQEFPDDIGIRWLLNLAYMTLGEHPTKVPAQYLMTFDKFGSEYDIGRFKDIAHLVGVNRFNQAGGAILDDFHNKGFLDLVVTTFDPTQPMALYRNKGDGTFEDRTEAAGLSKQYGGLNLVQADYNNDGRLDIFIVRGAWLQHPMRPSLLRNNGDGTFTDVTAEAGLMDPVNSICASWADYDNDGYLDLLICTESGPNRLYRNRGNGTFEEVASRAGLASNKKDCTKGAAWLDYDNDGYPDLFLNDLGSTAQLFHNNRDGTFSDVTLEMGIRGPKNGFSCWAFDYDNDGWLDIFATSYDRSLEDVVADIQGLPTKKGMEVTRLYRNVGGKKFEDVSKEAGVDKVFATMGSNVADFDNDGYLDFYLGTGDPSFATLVPNRMFKNIEGKRFAEITATSGTGHLQKGHGVACGDWNRDGNVDLFVQTGGVVPGDRYHNVLFQNPGQGNRWLTVKLIGKKSNRSALGARIKVVIKAVAAGDKALTVHRHVSSGSSFGANPLQQTIGLGKARSVATVEIYWPTTKTTQVFHDIDVDQAIEITEFASEYRKLKWAPIPIPKD